MIKNIWKEVDWCISNKRQPGLNYSLPSPLNGNEHACLLLHRHCQICMRHWGVLTDQQLPELLNLKANLIHSQHLDINELLQRHGLERGFILLLKGHWSDPRALQIALSTAQRVPCCMQALGEPLRFLRQCTVPDSDFHEVKWKSLSTSSGCSVDAAMTAALSEIDNISSSKEEHLTLHLTNLCLWQEFSKTPRSGDMKSHPLHQ